MPIEELIAWHTQPRSTVPVSAEVRRWQLRVEAQKRFNTSPVWRRGL